MDNENLSEREKQIWDTAHAVGFRDHALIAVCQKPSTNSAIDDNAVKDAFDCGYEAGTLHAPQSLARSEYMRRRK